MRNPTIGSSVVLLQFIDSRRREATKISLSVPEASADYVSSLTGLTDEDWTLWKGDLVARERVLMAKLTQCLPRRQVKRFRQHLGTPRQGGVRMGAVLGEARQLTAKVDSMRVSKVS